MTEYSMSESCEHTGRLPLCPVSVATSLDQKMIMFRLQRYNMDFVFEKLIRDGNISEELHRPLEREFKRFIALAGFGVCPLAVIGPLIDEVWHQFILFTKQYKVFCNETVGHFIDHQPDAEMTPVPIIAGENFRQSYRRYFGNLPDLWFQGMTEDTKRYYLQPVLTGKPPMAWSGWVGPA